MQKYVITLSRNFTLKHPRHGEHTGFCEKTLNAVCYANGAKWLFPAFGPKLHTIRGNYELWVKRFAKIEPGQAILSLRYWSGVPYNSKQIELLQLSNMDGIGLQMLEFRNGNIYEPCVNGRQINLDLIAYNDGLRKEDWLKWFEKEDLSEKFAIIHFTYFRY